MGLTSSEDLKSRLRPNLKQYWLEKKNGPFHFKIGKITKFQKSFLYKLRDVLYLTGFKR